MKHELDSTAYIVGETYEARESLKKSGWKWNSSQRRWEKEICGQDVRSCLKWGAETLTQEERLEIAKKMGGNKKGCAIFAANGSVTIWVSKTYVERIPAPTAADRRAGAAAAEFRMWNQDGRGQFCREDDHDAR